MHKISEIVAAGNWS